MSEINLCSWNINGLRAVLKKDFMQWLERPLPNGRPWHVVGLQEIKIQENQLPDEINNHPNFHLYCSHAKRPGYSGVALLINKDIEIIEIIEGIGIDEFDDEGRSLTLITENFILNNSYYPNGGRDHSRVDYKLRFSEEVLQFMKTLEKKHKKPVIMTGDFNTAHKEIDLKNPKANQKTTGFLPIEREWLDRLIDHSFYDIFREMHPDETGHYTWWTYRNNCRERNIGWRIDYFFIDTKHYNLVKEARILSEVMGSDHCPISLTLNLS